MSGASASTGKSGRFDPRQVLNDIRAASLTDSTSLASATLDKGETADDGDDDDDFMSDKFLVVSESKQPLTYAQKRHRHEARQPQRSLTKRSLRERELDARREGLDRDLLAEAEIIAGRGTLPPQDSDGRTRWDLLPDSATTQDSVFRDRDTQGLPTAADSTADGTTKAMKMMLAMGYKRGQALGKEETDVEEEVETDTDDDRTGFSSNDDDSPAREQDNAPLIEDDYLAGDVPATKAIRAATRHTEPLKLDERWLGVNKRAGIGMIPETSPAIVTAIQAASVNAQAERQRQQQHDEQDFRARASRAHQERHSQHLLVRARKTLIDLDTSLLDTEYSPLWLDSAMYRFLSGLDQNADPTNSLPQTTLDERMQPNPTMKQAFELLQLAFSSQNVGQIDEARTFCLLSPQDQLNLLLQYLRQTHYYCLFCGCKYDTAHDLDAHCPGQTEDDHD